MHFSPCFFMSWWLISCSVLNNIPCSRCTAVCLFIHLLKNNLACFQVLAVMNKAHFYIGVSFQFFLGKYQGAQLVGSYTKIRFSCARNQQTAFQSVIPTVKESFCCSTEALGFGGVSVWYSDRCIVVSHCFTLQFPNNICC